MHIELKDLVLFYLKKKIIYSYLHHFNIKEKKKSERVKEKKRK